MSDELRAAAERVMLTYRSDAPAWQVARAYLAAHSADDAEPVGSCWLDELSKSNRDKVDWCFEADTNLLCIEVKLHGIFREIVLPTGATRGDVRRLCRALQIPLTDS